MSKTETNANLTAPPRFNLQAVVLAVVTLPILALSLYIAHIRTDDIDAWFFLHYGRELLSGATLYTDIWDIKPPGIFWINAIGLALAGGSPVGVTVICALAIILSAVFVYRIAMTIYDQPTAVIGTIFAVVYLNLWTYHVGGNRPATFLILTELGSAYLYLKYVSGSTTQRRCLFWAGVCGGLGLWFKQTAFAAPAAILIHLLIVKPSDSDSRWNKVSLFGTGYLCSIAALVLTLAITSDLGWAWDAIVGFNRKFFAPGIATSLVPSVVWIGSHCNGMALPLILAPATLAHPVFKSFYRKSDKDEGDSAPTVLPFLWIWLLFAIYLAAVGPHNRPMYLAVALPPLVMLATHSVYLLINSARNQQNNMPPHYVVVGIIWFAYMLWTPLHLQIDFALRQFHRSTQPTNPNLLATVEAIQRYAGPDDAIFINGYAPELYWRAERHQAIRYLGTEKIHQLQQFGQPLMDETTRSLKDSKPRVILFDFNRFDSASSPNIANVDELERWVRDNYDQPESVRFPTLWVRRETPR